MKSGYQLKQLSRNEEAFGGSVIKGLKNTIKDLKNTAAGAMFSGSKTA